MKPNTRILIVANFLAFAGVLAVNFLANSLPLNGKNTGEISAQYPNLFTPAGLTFSIWGIIYIWLAVFVGFQIAALFKKTLFDRVGPIVDKTGWLFLITCLFNVSWLFAWHWNQLLLSVLIMLGFLGTLLQLNKSIGVGHFKVNRLEKLLSHWPFGIYQGWITVATIANITALLVASGWKGGSLGEAAWAIVMILIGMGLALWAIFKQNNLGHGLAVAWAIYGIYVQRNIANDPSSEWVGLVGIGSVVFLVIFTVSRWQNWKAY